MNTNQLPGTCTEKTVIGVCYQKQTTTACYQNDPTCRMTKRTPNAWIRRMGSNSYRRLLNYLTSLLLLAVLTALMTGYHMTQFGHSVHFSLAGVPKPRETKPEWCSSVFESQALTNSSLVEDVFALTPPDFEQQFKNPCFYDACYQNGNRTTRKLRCLPYFHVLGVDKCGSTDLYYRLVRHPQILPNKGILNKETMWWSWRRYGHTLRKDTHQKETFLDYLHYFDGLSEKLEKSQHDYYRVTGDGTPMDFWDFSGWPQIPQNVGLQDPKILTPHLMKYFNPYLKFILIFRQPSERLFSDYIFLKLGEPTPKAFHGKVVKSITMFNNCRKKHTLRVCLFNRELHVKMPVRLHVGIYSVFLEEWLKVFDSINFLFLRTEDYSRNIKGTLKTVFSFLGVDELPEQKLNEISEAEKVYKTKRKKKSDFKQAFDTVWRHGLWTKILQSGIDGKCFRFIRNMYKGIKSKVQIGQHLSDFFMCNVGVRQGENLSPFLFSLFINDLEDYLTRNQINGFTCPSQQMQDDMFVMLKLCILFYADDTVLMSESASDLQKSLDVFAEYCDIWKLRVNIAKTKVLIFSKGPMAKRKFLYNGVAIENVREFCYLGLFLSRSGKFNNAKKHSRTSFKSNVWSLT
ncbi:uncharacterized protein LOC133184104 isoform X3 [Saccostrea echinata]|uniref:uncharacterized protein LOC133184104 isoform X3 n=1 Tax=Saccostrea echinata TaxID=191078 RepID=UPI002A80378B|nr:uncharacterized protein LOC133184104 isoform X3 [Saccostrea echinata]